MINPVYLRIEMVGAYQSQWILHSDHTDYPRARQNYDSYRGQWPNYSWRLKDLNTNKVLMTFVGKQYKPQKRDSHGRFSA